MRFSFFRDIRDTLHFGAGALGLARPPVRRRHARLDLPGQPDVIYAIGDVHGHIDALRELHERITLDASRTAGKKLIVMLGDYIDRGSHSAAVLDYLTQPAPPGTERICLLGNHEKLMLDVLEGKSSSTAWLAFGGEQTLLSYGLDIAYLRGQLGLGPMEIAGQLREAIPETHLALLNTMPIMVTTPDYVFAHAGIKPGVELDRQTDDDLLWIRNEFLDARQPHPEKIVVHGHTPVTRVEWPGRISVDTGAYLGRKLTAARIAGKNVDLISVQV